MQPWHRGKYLEHDFVYFYTGMNYSCCFFLHFAVYGIFTLVICFHLHPVRSNEWKRRFYSDSHRGGMPLIEASVIWMYSLEHHFIYSLVVLRMRQATYKIIVNQRDTCRCWSDDNFRLEAFMIHANPNIYNTNGCVKGNGMRAFIHPCSTIFGK